MKNNQQGFHLLPIIVVVLVLGVVGFVGVKVMKESKDGDKSLSIGIDSWKRDCSGSGVVPLTHAPMDMKDVTSILPYGLLAGAHVTPIDHVYFYPKSQQRDAAPVYAMADGYIVQYQERTQNIDSGTSKQGEYRVVIQHSCTFFTYFDLMTSMDKTLQDELKKGDPHVAVKAGQEIGRVGGQSLDSGAYNTEAKLTGLKESSYAAEPWKVYTYDFFKEFTEPAKSQMLALNPRQAEPRSGKIDYDQPGKLIGNWFVEGTNGYAGPKEYQSKPGQNGKGYWSTHFSVSYDALDPTKIAFGFGEFNGKADAFMAAVGSPDPAQVSVASGPTKYELHEYRIYGGRPVAEIVQNLNNAQNPQVKGTLLVQVLDGEKLKMEVFPNKPTDQVTGFTSAAKIYER